MAAEAELPDEMAGRPARPSGAIAWPMSLAWLGVVALAAYLRAWHIGSQIPFDDEWHGLAYVVQHDAAFLLTHYTRLGANSVPHNLYLRLVFRTVGLSEWSIVLPSLLAGVLLVWTFGRWLGRRVGAVTGLVAGLLLALSPFLIFYSRCARPYAPLLLFEALALTHLSDWTREGRRRQGALAVLFGVLAVWTHLTAVPALLGAWVAAALWQWRRRTPAEERSPGPLRVLRLALVGAALAALASLPAILNTTNAADQAWAPFTLRTADLLTQLLCGSSRVELRMLVALGTLGGFIVLARRAPREVVIAAAMAGGAVAAVLLDHPQLAEIGAIFARYTLPLFLLVPMAVGAGAQGVLERVSAPRLRQLTAAAGLPALAAALCFSGPLPFVFADHASFTKHPVFQYQYVEVTPRRSLPDPVYGDVRPLFRGELHPFYDELARQPPGTAVIEYPFIVGQDFNRLYFPQLIHHQPVLAGYYASGAGGLDRYGLALGQGKAELPPVEHSGFVPSVMTIDHAFGALADRSGIRFRTVVDLGNPAAIRRSGARYVILHWNLPGEFTDLAINPNLGEARGRFVATLRDRLAAELGRPIFEDRVLTVFAVR